MERFMITKINIKFPILLLLFFILFVLCGCLGDFAGDTAIISIKLNGGSAAGKAAVSINELEHIITLTGPTGEITLTVIGEGTARAVVATGLWQIDVKGYFGEELYSTGTASTEVEAWRTANVAIQMTVVWLDKGGPGVPIPYDPGDGTEGNPFKVYNPATLQKIGTGTDGWNLDVHYILTENINMTGQDFTPIGSIGTGNEFTGTLNGNGKIIIGLTINSSSSAGQGLFGIIAGTAAKVNNLTLTRVDIGASLTGNTVGAVVGSNIGGTVVNCRVSGNINGFEQVGGVVGINDGTVSECVFITGSISGIGLFNNSIGGVVGLNNSGSMLEKCYSSGSVTGGDTVGGLAGWNEGTIENCYSMCDVSVVNTEAGGVVGFNQNYGVVTNCYFNGSVSGENFVGGVVGNNDGTIAAVVSNCVALNPDITRTGGIDIDFGRVVGINTGSGSLTNNYGRCSILSFYDVTPSFTFSPSSFNFNQLTGFHGAQITTTQWEDVGWWTGTALFTDSWWSGKLPPVVP